MTSSSDFATAVAERVIRAAAVTETSPLPTPDLRGGVWTRLGAGPSRGDAVIESTLDALAERTRQAAHSEGYAVGWARGTREAALATDQAAAQHELTQHETEERRRREHAAAVAALTAAAHDLHTALSTIGTRLEERSSELAYAVTAAVLGEAAAQQTATDLLRRVEEHVTDTLAVVRLHPDHAAAVARELPATVRVVADPSMGPADALVELDDSIVDLRVDRALARVQEALR